MDFGVVQLGQESETKTVVVTNPAPIQSGVSQEEDGRVVIEIESEPAATGWTPSTTLAGYKGDSYYQWSGPNSFSQSQAGKGEMIYRFQIHTPGNYELRLRSRIGIKGTTPGECLACEHNDTWFKFPTGVDVANEFPLDETKWTKVFVNQFAELHTDQWSWATRPDVQGEIGRSIRQFFSAGIHELRLSGRSQGHALDRFVLYKYDSESFSATKFDAYPPSEKEVDNPEDPEPVEITAIYVSGANADKFILDDVGSVPGALSPGESLDVDLRVLSNVGGRFNASLVIETTGPESPIVLPLTAYVADLQTLPLRVNCGVENETTDESGVTWLPDALFDVSSKSGQFSVKSTVEINATTIDSIFRTERFGRTGSTISYEIPVPAAGDYLVTVYLAEIFFTETGKRVFDVFIEEAEVISDLDMVSEVGGFTAFSRSFPATVGADKILNLDFAPSIENAKVSAIVVEALSD